MLVLCASLRERTISSREQRVEGQAERGAESKRLLLAWVSVDRPTLPVSSAARSPSRAALPVFSPAQKNPRERSVQPQFRGESPPNVAERNSKSNSNRSRRCRRHAGQGERPGRRRRRLSSDTAGAPLALPPRSAPPPRPPTPTSAPCSVTPSRTPPPPPLLPPLRRQQRRRQRPQLSPLPLLLPPVLLLRLGLR